MVLVQRGSDVVQATGMERPGGHPTLMPESNHKVEQRGQEPSLCPRSSPSL